MSIALSLAELEGLLEEKGYLADNFFKANAVKYWLDAIREEYEMRYNHAKFSGEIDRFSKESVGVFDSGIDLVKFTFYFEIDPEAENLHLFHLQTQLGKVKKNYILQNDKSLPAAQDAYKMIKKLAIHRGAYKRNKRLKDEFKWQRESENDFKPEEPKTTRCLRLILPLKPPPVIIRPSSSRPNPDRFFTRFHR